MFDPNQTNQKELQIMKDTSFLRGVFFDPSTGPIAASRLAAVLTLPSPGRVRAIDNSITEDIYPENELDAHYARLGWPSLTRLPTKPWDILVPRTQRARRTEVWGLRRLMVQKMSINLSVQDLCPSEELVEAIKAALGRRTTALRVRALRTVFTTWGEMIPLSAVVGASMVTTGMIGHETALPDSNIHARSPSEDRAVGLNELVDQHLGLTSSFTRRLESRVQGGSSVVFLSEGFESWLKTVNNNPASWEIIKIDHAVPITDILDEQLRERVEQLFTSSIILRSPSVGSSHLFSFDTTANGLRDIEKITVWFSNLKVRDISVAYAGGAVAGPYSFGTRDQEAQSDTFVLAPGEYVTDVFVWNHLDGWISAIQFTKNTLELSPIYGVRSQDSIATHPPVLLAGNGNSLLGISGAYTPDYLTQIQASACFPSAVWRGDVVLRRQRQTQTSFVGGTTGHVFNDLQYLADPASARIVQITARTKDSVARFQVTYESVSGDALVRTETPVHGDHTGPLMTIKLEEGEYITRVHGYHNNHGLQRIQFTTNKKTHPAFGAETGNVEFNFDAPKTRDGREMVLHYMSGKSRGWLDAVLFVWAEMPLKVTGA